MKFYFSRFLFSGHFGHGGQGQHLNFSFLSGLGSQNLAPIQLFAVIVDPGETFEHVD